MTGWYTVYTIHNQEDKRAKVVYSQLQDFGFCFTSFGIIFIVVTTSEQLNYVVGIKLLSYLTLVERKII